MPKQKYKTLHHLDRIEKDKYGREIPIYKIKKTLTEKPKNDTPIKLQA